MADLEMLGKKLVAQGPLKIEKTPRRVRGLLGGIYIFDTTETRYVWEDAYPLFYIPKMAFVKDVLEMADPQTDERYSVIKISVGEMSTRTARAIVFDCSGELEDLVRIEICALDAWFIEDEKLIGNYLKDPYKRIDCIPSSREVRIEIDGVILAQSSQNIFLFETLSRPRYYLPPTSIDWKALSESDTTSFCPYKGVASYYSVLVDGKLIKDVLWCYQYPVAESAMIAGRFCFSQESVDIFLDGIKEGI